MLSRWTPEGERRIWVIIPNHQIKKEVLVWFSKHCRYGAKINRGWYLPAFRTHSAGFCRQEAVPPPIPFHFFKRNQSTFKLKETSFSFSFFFFFFFLLATSLKLLNIKFWNPEEKTEKNKFWTENRKVTYLLWFWKFWPPPPTWHQILKPIRLLVAIFYYLKI